ncbi:gliding motility-associated C-terminal domain-containing protein [Hyunsoonleella sp. SJ7]|uniref:Gliding motility-associated C-terminal domain-containing protein n=1 Tax=Hyunsoonleella aquatilis TaxID=2762758 RepID=A0A923KKI8_9FLAO|nr:gliding motility-associated C-terminal domain-containing protein [Hyunsoonleella aquatilis]MBC3756875.1 gliding motility-associated C-terminal domain-containing protein [Hyunsoonleella aquatilis]
MTTKSTSRNAWYYAFLIFLSWGATSSLYAQCPTITDPNPPPICDASGFTFNDLNAFATDGGDGIVWYDMLSGGSAFNPNELVPEGTYYADNDSGDCATRPSITVDFQVNATGVNLDEIYCSNENSTVQDYNDDVLQPSFPTGATSVEIYYDLGLTIQANSTDIFSVGGTNLYIIFIDGSNCRSQIEFSQVGVFSSPTDPTPVSPQEFCSDSNPLVGNLDPGTTATNFNWYANLDGSGNPIPPALALTTPLVDGNTYYIQIDDIFCVSNPVAVTVNIDDPADAGSSGNLEYCNDSLPGSDFDLFNELGGTPEASGSWSGPLATSNGHLGTVNISSLTTAGIYTFTYTVSGNGACPDATANVVITVYETLSSGTPSLANPATYCESTVPTNLDLFTLLDNEDPNGQWTQGTSSTDPVVASPIDLTGFTANTYNFTYTQNLLPNPCPEESTTVQVVVLPDPHAGNAINQTFCENDLSANSPFDLFDALDGSQDNNSGTWTDSGSNTISNSIDITSFTVAGSPYLFTYTIDNGSCSDSEQISITVEDAPESGNPVASFPEYCEGSAPSNYNLFDLLENEDQTGTWYIGTDNTGATTTNTQDLSSFIPGTYDYTFDVDAIGSCDDVLVTVQITINPLPNTGIPDSPTYCENDLASNSPLDLFGQLTGEDSGGTWTDDGTSGALTGSDVDLTLLTIGSYNFNYTITDSNGCTNSSSVTITVEDAPESGSPVATFPEYCEGSAPSSYNLFDLLENEDQAGTWYVGTDNTGAATTNTQDLSSLIPGTYDYTFDVDAIGSCDDPLVTVQVIINPLPNTGIPDSPTYCENDLVSNSPLDLFGQLSGEDNGGTWTDDDASGALTGSDVDLTALTIGNYSFTYTITDANGCTNSSTVTITVEDAPESGTANTPVEFCLVEITVGQTYNLFDLLSDEDQTGSWNDDDASGALSGNVVAIDGLMAGTYNFTYDVDAIGSCDDVDVTVSIVINDSPPPGAPTPQSFCDSGTVGDLSATGNNIQWYDIAVGGTPLDASTDLVDGQTYYATQTDATTNCESSVRTAISVNIYQTPNAGDPNSTGIVACNDNTAIDLFTGLDGSEDAGGTWQNDDGVGNLSGSSLDATGVTPGTYQFTYLVSGNAPCVDDSETITITIEAPLNAGPTINPTLDICSNNGAVDLFTLLGGADTGGTWSPALDSGTGLFDPLVDPDGTYTYTLSNSCGTFTNEIAITVTQAPNAGTSTSVGLCMIDAPIDLFTELGNPQTGGTWSPALASGTGVFDPAVDAPGVYTYTIIAIAPCSPDNSATVTVAVNDSPPLTVLDPNPTFCLTDNPTVADLTNSVQATGTITWYDDASLTTALNASDALVDGEDYFGTQTDGTNCESSMNVELNVTINDMATPTLNDTSETYCINDGPTIATLSDNVLEYDANADNLRWYDAPTGGNLISEDTTLGLATYYAVLVDPNTGCESSVRLEVTPDITACGDIRIPDGFSPNDDGMNDTFDIDNLAILYPNFEMEIYNRNGNIVYRGNANTPRFDGTSNQVRVALKGDLPVGVYFYIFSYNDGIKQPVQGRLYLSR